MDFGGFKFKKLLKGLEWIVFMDKDHYEGEPLQSFDSMMILFKDGEFIIQPADCENPNVLDNNDLVRSYTYVNERNRIDCLHTTLLYLIVLTNKKSEESFLRMQFNIEEFFKLFENLHITVTKQDKDSKTEYSALLPIESNYNTINFTVGSIVEASKVMLKLLYSGSL